MVEDVPGHGLVLNTHLNKVEKASDTAAIHATLGFEELTKEGICHTLHASTLELDVLIADQLNELDAVLLDLGAEVGLRENLGYTEDPFQTSLLERVINLQEDTDLLKGLDKRIHDGLVDSLQVCLGHLLADLLIFACHANEDVAEVSLVGSLTRLNHLLEDLFVLDNGVVQLIQRVPSHHITV